jgi:hypothetical protein
MFTNFLLCLHDVGSSERLAVQNPQIPKTAETNYTKMALSSPLLSQTKIGLPPVVRVLYWLLPSPQKNNRLAMKGVGFLGVAGGN